MMKFLLSVIAALHLLDRGTASPASHIASTPGVLASRFPCGGSGCTPPQTEQAIQNASLVLGWQLAGIMADEQQVHDACGDIQTVSHGKWHEVGLDGFTVQRALCTALNTSSTTSLQAPPNSPWLPDLSQINQTLVEHSTNLFLTQLLHAFSAPGTPGNLTEPPSPNPADNTTAAIFSHICSTLKCATMDALQLNGTLISEQVCAVAGLPSNTTAATLDPTGPTAATVERYIYTRGELFATQLGLTARTATEANAMCNASSVNAPANSTILTAPYRYTPLGMEPDEVNATLCGNPADLSQGAPPLWGAFASDRVIQRALTVNTEMFATVVEVISRDDGWVPFLCEYFDADGLSSTNVDGEMVVNIMCENMRMGPPP